ncbi:MAG: hypothetical protein J6O51_05855 [Bacteroidales bacterium]|nr:hypothetical protein [Bacteroidales bacterium]
MRAFRNILLALAGLLEAAALCAQELPSLAKAPEITTGKLPDGISYYLVKNTASPGFADFALVQPLRGKDNSPREDLVSLPHFLSRKPYNFLANNSISYGERGWIQNTRGATVFRFADVPVAVPEVSDSTLLMIFDIARSSEHEQALVVSGNIDVAAIQERIRILSMTLSSRIKVTDAVSYAWKPQDDLRVTSGNSPVGEIAVSYRSPRTDRELMNTIQPVMSRVLASEFQLILQKRLRGAFRQAGIPLADYRFRYIGSDESAGDELFLIRIYTSESRLSEATAVVAGVLSSLDDEGVNEEETAFARSVISSASARDSKTSVMSNAQWVDKCIASYLYGSNLASSATIGSLFTGRKLDIGRETELLNRYIASFLSPKRNMHLHFAAPVQPDAAALEEAFRQGWRNPLSVDSGVPTPEDTLKLVSPRRKVRLKTTSPDSFSGGKMWTFSNGINVVFKKMPSKGSFRYGFMVKGGWAEIKDINAAESAVACDVLELQKVAGMSGEHFRDLLAMNGISIQPQLTLSDVRFTGAASSSSLSLVLKAMLSLANMTAPDPEAYQSYREEKAIRLQRDKFSLEGTRAVLDSTMCPAYRYAAGSLPELPGSDFPVRMSEYLAQKGSTMRNGLIVLVGDLDENAVLKQLTHTLGDFRTLQQRVSRPRLPYPLRECWSTSYDHGSWREIGVNVSLSALLPFSAESKTTLQLACAVLETELARAMASKGVHCSVSGAAELLPTEQLTVFINCKACPRTGLPADVVPATPLSMLESVREVVNRLSLKEIDAATMARCKTLLTNRLAAADGNPKVLCDAILYRNSTGRDLVGARKDIIKSIKSSDVQKLFKALSACNCEYVVQ